MRKETVIKQRRLFTEGRRFISEDRKEGDVYDTLHLGKIKCCIPIFHTQTYIKKTATYQNNNGGRSHFGPGVHDELLLMCLFVCLFPVRDAQPEHGEDECGPGSHHTAQLPATGQRRR